MGELIALAGPNGCGKSSVLELLSFGITHRYSWQYYQSRKITDHSFAVRIGLTEEELRALEDSQKMDSEALAYARAHRGYWMQVNFPDALDVADIKVNERVHGHVSRQFKNYARKLGFFLRADRGYGARKYDRRALFNWKKKMDPGYFSRISYGQTTLQYEDMYDFLVEQSYHYIYNLGLYHKNLNDGIASATPEDPLGPYNTLLGELFPGYSFVDATAEDLTLKVRIESGDVLPFEDLSSGEKEVFFILSFFLRNDVADSIIIIDEPELHLHPELARKLLHLMRTIKAKNQVWCATHSAELIDEAGRERTFYLRASADRKATECIAATEEGSEIQMLRDMFGYAGYVGISRKVVFSEGCDSSADRRTFANILPGLSREIKIIPVGSWDNLYRLNQAILAVLESDFARCDFYLIRDRDYLSEEAVSRQRKKMPGRLFVLSRYHIENFLLDESAISATLRDVYQIRVSPDQIREDIFRIAVGNSAGFLRDMTASRLGECFQSEDCGIGNHSQGQRVIDADGKPVDGVVDCLRNAFAHKISEIQDAANARSSLGNQRKVFDDCLNEVRSCLRLEDDGWKRLFPGRYLLQKLSGKHGLGKWPAFQNVLIDRLAKGDLAIDEELRRIFGEITEKMGSPK